MSEPRYAGMLVTLKQDLRGNNREATLAAIGMIKGVLFVEPVMDDPALQIAEHRVRVQLGARLVDVLSTP